MKILLATDGSSDSDAAADFLNRLPRTDPWHVHLVTNLFLPIWDAASSNPDLQQYRQQQLQQARENFQRIESVLTAGRGSFEHMIVDGDIGHSIVVAADQIGADLVILGAKGHSAISRMLLGSVSDYVATHANCNVLVVRPPAPASDQPIKVVIAYDDSPPSQQALTQFARFDWAATVTGLVLAVVPAVRLFRQDLTPAGMEHRIHCVSQAQSQVAAAAERLAPAAPLLKTEVVEGDHVGDQIVEFLARQGTGLVVVGDRRRNGIRHVVLGSVSRYVLRHAPCSVWIARQQSSSSP